MGIQCVWNNSYPLLTYLTKERINACEELLEIFCVFIPFWYRKKTVYFSFRSPLLHFLVHVSYFYLHIRRRNYRVCYNSDAVPSPKLANWQPSKQPDLICCQTLPSDQIVGEVCNYSCSKPSA